MQHPFPQPRRIVSAGRPDSAYLARLDAQEEAMAAQEALDRAHYYLDKAQRRHAVAQAHLVACNEAWIRSEGGKA